jgi:sterol 3beta-glucosyltransferase
MPGVIKNDEITNETAGPSNLERSRTERRRQNNPADNPAKQLLDERIPIKKKVHISYTLYLSIYFQKLSSFCFAMQASEIHICLWTGN